jgi:hypothetical protein
VIPESVPGVGSVSAHELDLGGAALDIRFPTKNYLGIQGTITESDVDREIGVFQFDSTFQQQPPGSSTQIPEQLRYREVAVQSTINQLLGDYWSIGLAYRYSNTRLDRAQHTAAFASHERADLHSLRCQAVFNLPKGFFAAASSLFLWQNDHAIMMGQHDNTTIVSNESHVQVDLECGWRFPRQLGEFSVGLLNLVGKDYRLAPLSGIPELPRDRVLLARLRLNF